jgi:hypothetical protein
VTLAVLADLNETWLPREDVFQAADFESRFRFPVCKLVARLESDWRNDNTLAVQLARAQIEALRTSGDPEGRLRAKWRVVRPLYDLGYNPDEVREVFRLIDWMMHLREDLSRRFEEELMSLEASLNMPYITSVERIAEARGETKGASGVLLRQVRKLWSPLPAAVAERISGLSIESLEALGEAVLGFRSLAELESWLDDHGP